MELPLLFAIALATVGVITFPVEHLPKNLVMDVRVIGASVLLFFGGLVLGYVAFA